MNTIDLHNVKHEDVKKILNQAILKCKKNKKNRLWVATSDSKEIKKTVMEVIFENKLIAVENMFNSDELIIDFI